MREYSGARGLPTLASASKGRSHVTSINPERHRLTRELIISASFNVAERSATAFNLISSGVAPILPYVPTTPRISAIIPEGVCTSLPETSSTKRLSLAPLAPICL